MKDANLECVIRAVMKKFSNASSIKCNRCAQRDSWSRKPYEHEIGNYGHHLGKKKLSSTNLWRTRKENLNIVKIKGTYMHW